MFDLGGALSESRIRQGIELSDVERATRIRERYLTALEEERFDLLPEEAYAKGFLRTYAHFLGLDGQLFVDEFSRRLAADEPAPPAPPEPRFVIPRPGARTTAVAGAAIVAVLAAVLAWRFAESQSAAPARSSGTAAHFQPSTPVEKPPGPTAHRPAKARLVLVAAGGDCWLSVRKGSREGPVIFEGLLAQGNEVRAVGKRLWVRLGAPWNLEARLNGNAVAGLPARTGNVIVTSRGVRPESG